MNYYEHHLGDYAAATAHLSWDEDMAYQRLIRAYYHHEKPIPADLKAACRLVRAETKTQRQAVETVLREFFELYADGWRQKRCESEIERYKASEPEREAKKTNEAIRLKRHREERAALFAVLNAHGEHAAWNISMNELRTRCSRYGPPLQEALPATAPATPATATHTQYPDTIPRHHTQPREEDGGPAPSAAPPPTPPPFDGRNAEALNGRAIVPIAADFDLPEQWGMDAEKLGFRPPEVLRESERFRQYWVAGRGAGTRRSVKGWRQSWSTWLAKAAKDAQR